jgi:hypothetical protein
MAFKTLQKTLKLTINYYTIVILQVHTIKVFAYANTCPPSHLFFET